MKKILTLTLAILFALAAMTASLAEAEMAEGADSDWYMDILADWYMLADFPYHALVDINDNGVPVLLISTTGDSFITVKIVGNRPRTGAAREFSDEQIQRLNFEFTYYHIDS